MCIRDSVKNNSRPVEFEISTSEHYTRPQLERGILQDLIRRDSRFRGAAEQLADLMVQVKEMALIGSAPEIIVETVRQGLPATEIAVTETAGAEEGYPRCGSHKSS